MLGALPELGTAQYKMLFSNWFRFQFLSIHLLKVQDFGQILGTCWIRTLHFSSLSSLAVKGNASRLWAADGRRGEGGVELGCVQETVMLIWAGPELASPAQWLHLRQTWQRGLQFPSRVSLGLSKGSTQPCHTGQTPTSWWLALLLTGDWSHKPQESRASNQDG